MISEGSSGKKFGECSVVVPCESKNISDFEDIANSNSLEADIRILSNTPPENNFPDMSAIVSEVSLNKIDGEERGIRDLYARLAPMVTVAVGSKVVKFPQLNLCQV